nr:hypothetical protein [Tanacetum cinerariifolium]GEW28472.1 hypothetical protein [Tanacetum cinerariifolium]
MLRVDQVMVQENEHKAKDKTKEGEQVYGLMAGFKSDFADHAGNPAGSVYDVADEFAMMGISPKAKIKKNEWEFKLVESLARTKLGLGFKEYIGSYEVFDLSTPSVFDHEPKNKEVKSLYERFVKAGEMHEVPPPITGTFMPTSYKSDLEESQVTFDNFPSIVSKAAYVPTGSRNSSASIFAGRSIPAASRNRPASIHVGRHFHAGRFNKPSPFPAGRSVPTDENMADLLTKAFDGPRFHYLNETWIVQRGTALELASPEQTAIGKDVSNLFMAVMVYQKPLGYFSSPMIHVPRAGLVIHPPGYVVPAGLKIYLGLDLTDVIIIHPKLDPFLDNFEETKKVEDDWDHLLDIDFGDIPEINKAGLPPFFCEIGKNTGSDMYVMPYRIYAKLGREEVKKVNWGITMLNHSKAEPMGVLKDVLYQVGVTTIIVKFLILDIPIDRDAPILVGREFLNTCGSILNTRDRITSTLDGVCHQIFHAAETSLNTKESDSDDEEEYGIQRNNFG